MTINEPTDHTREYFNPIARSQSFSVSLIDPCLKTVLDRFRLPDVTISVLHNTPFKRKLLPKVPDYISRIYGKKDGLSFCGERSFKVLQLSKYAEFLSVNDEL